MAAARVVVIHEGGTPWWVPLAVGLSVAAVAALASVLRDVAIQEERR